MSKIPKIGILLSASVFYRDNFIKRLAAPDICCGVATELAQNSENDTIFKRVVSKYLVETLNAIWRRKGD